MTDSECPAGGSACRSAAESLSAGGGSGRRRLARMLRGATVTVAVDEKRPVMCTARVGPVRRPTRSPPKPPSETSESEPDSEESHHGHGGRNKCSDCQLGSQGAMPAGRNGPRTHGGWVVLFTTKYWRT